MLENNILKLRKQLGFSQEELSEKVNVTRQTISNWELNETQPNPEQLKLLSKALNVSIDDLIGNDIKNVVEEKIDSTEKNTKIIIRVLTVIGVLIFFLFAFEMIYQYTHRDNKVKSIELNCNLNDKNYIIDIKSNNYYKCVNCSKELSEEIENQYFDSSDLDTSARNIEFYFNENKGTCKIKKDY